MAKIAALFGVSLFLASLCYSANTETLSVDPEDQVEDGPFADKLRPSVEDWGDQQRQGQQPARSPNPQQLSCYEGPGPTGSSLRGNVDYIRDLSLYGMDDKIGYCCYSGSWILYEDKNFNEMNTKAHVTFDYGDNNCQNLPPGMVNTVSSLKFVGDRDDWKRDTLTLYRWEYFISDEQFLEQDVASFRESGYVDNLGRSGIITGCSDWTLYSGDKYSGSSICLRPSNDVACFPGFFTSFQYMEGIQGQVSSARKGCYSDKIINSEPLMRDKD